MIPVFPVFADEATIEWSDDPWVWFGNHNVNVGGIGQILADIVASIKYIGFGVALTASIIYLAGYIISGTPAKREVYKEKVMSLYLLVFFLFAGLGIADVLYDIAKTIGS